MKFQLQRFVIAERGLPAHLRRQPDFFLRLSQWKLIDSTGARSDKYRMLFSRRVRSLSVDRRSFSGTGTWRWQEPGIRHRLQTFSKRGQPPGEVRFTVRRGQYERAIVPYVNSALAQHVMQQRCILLLRRESKLHQRAELRNVIGRLEFVNDRA